MSEKQAAIKELTNRIRHLEAAVAAQQQLFEKIRVALTGHQESIEALASMAGVDTTPKPIRPEDLN